jgi:hypothetical protein
MQRDGDPQDTSLRSWLPGSITSGVPHALPSYVTATPLDPMVPTATQKVVEVHDSATADAPVWVGRVHVSGATPRARRPVEGVLVLADELTLRGGADECGAEEPHALTNATLAKTAASTPRETTGNARRRPRLTGADRIVLPVLLCLRVSQTRSRRVRRQRRRTRLPRGRSRSREAASRICSPGPTPLTAKLGRLRRVVGLWARPR